MNKENNKTSYWKEISNSYSEYSEDGNCEKNVKRAVNIDAWRTDNSDDEEKEEEGKVIARVLVCEGNIIIVEYRDLIAKNDTRAQEIINETIKDLEKEFPKEQIASLDIDIIQKLEKISEDLNSINVCADEVKSIELAITRIAEVRKLIAKFN